MADHGLVVQDEDGSVYFLRPEILEAAKVPGDLHATVHGAMHAGGHAKVIGTLDPQSSKLSAGDGPKGLKAQVPSTIMCPW
jgi:hypothetical protein